RAGGRRNRRDPAGAARQSLPVARNRGPSTPWLAELLKRKSPKLAAVALANKACPGAGVLSRKIGAMGRGCGKLSAGCASG
ncbi:MAG TPA: hypothetical protein VHY78_06825, partial [Stellaceae bacterium]|nr:hypothetical protein [Stellaceae bacterium]